MGCQALVPALVEDILIAYVTAMIRFCNVFKQLVVELKWIPIS